MKTFYNVVNSIIFCSKEARASIVRSFSICIMAGKTLLALSISIYGFYVLLSHNFSNPVDNDLDKTTMFMHEDRQTSSNAKNTENSYSLSAQANRLGKASNMSCWYIIQTMDEVKLILKEKYLRRRLAFTATSIATFNPIIYHLELTLQPLTGNHAAHCYFGNTKNGSRTSTTMDDDFHPITVFNLPKQGLKIVQLNTRSITNKLDQIRLMMHKKSTDILAITETWLDNSWTDNELVITGYNLFRRDRKTAQGGGIIVYTHNSLSAERRSDVESGQIEQISIEFKQFRCAPILLSCFYRPPDSTVSLFDILANIVDSIAAEIKEVHIVGDFNVDLIKKSSSESKQILHLMEYQGFQQMVKTPTRITENSSTLIDHHYCSHPEHVLSITSPVFGLSDHNPTILVRKQNANLKSTKKAHFTVTYRPLKKLNVNSRIKDLNEVPWTVLDTFDNDQDEMLSTWEAVVLDVVDRHAPLKSVRVKSMKKPSWLSNEILKAIKERDRLKKELEKGRIQRMSFNAARNKLK